MSEFRDGLDNGSFVEAESDFQHEQTLMIGQAALDKMADIFLGVPATEVADRFSFRLRSEERKGAFIPGAHYDHPTGKITVIIEPESVEEYADDISDEVNDGVESGDIVRVLIGAGVAKAILGWRTSQLGLDDEGAFRRHKEVICQKSDLWEAAAKFDDLHSSNIRRAVERLGDDELMRINWLRFSLGASLRYMSDVPNLQNSMVEHMQKELLSEETTRAIELQYNLGWQEPESAFANYDSKVPFIELAFSFPMSPSEEQKFMEF